MEELVRGTPAAGLQPWGFMVAWDGVLVLAYRGFPAPLVDLKHRIGRVFPELPAENAGSRWPKTTLGAVSEPQTRLTLEQLRVLKRVCIKCSEEMRGELDGVVLPVNSLAVVLYCCTSTERRLITHTIHAHQTSPLITKIGQEELQRVDSVLAEFDEEKLEEYLGKVATGRNTALDYRSHRRGSTLVYELPPQGPLAEALQRFRERVDEALGKGFYAWFDSSALHVTVRGL